jgi:DNA-binding CsgD family transcriptional regulator
VRGVQKLNARERLVVRSGADGDSVRDTARQLGFSEGLVKQLRGSAFQKLEARNIAHAVALALLSGQIAYVYGEDRVQVVE